MLVNITAISDTHAKHRGLSLRGGDILIHSGDFTNIGGHDEVVDFIEWFSRQPYEHKVFIAGNHDLTFESEVKYNNFIRNVQTPVSIGKPKWLIDILSTLPSSVHYLYNNSVSIMGLTIWGSPVTPEFGSGWAYNARRGDEIRRVWDTIPTSPSPDIVVTHGPAGMVLDYVDYTHTGCIDLHNRLIEVKPKVHIFGHIHEGYGYVYKNNIHHINASIINNQRHWQLNAPVDFTYNGSTISFI